MAKYCQKCGSEVNPQAKFCSKCGNPLMPKPTAPKSMESLKVGARAATPEKLEPIADGFYRDIEENGTGAKGNKGVIIAIAVLAILLIVAVGGLFVYKMLSGKEKKQEKPNNTAIETTIADEEDDEESEAIIIITTEDSLEEDDEMEEEPSEISNIEMQEPVQLEEEEPQLDGVSADNEPNYDICATPNAYTVVEVSDEFSFGYPKNFFNNVSIDGSDYIFTTSDNSATLTVKKVETTSNDPISAVKYYHDQKIGLINSNDQTQGVNIVSSKVKEDGWAHALAGGPYKNSGNGSGTYNIVVSNGSETYNLYFDYVDMHKGYYTTQMYMVDCIYRLCEHSGTNYYVRDYSQFCKDDMGTKK